MSNRDLIEQYTYLEKLTEADQAKLDEIERLGKLLMDYAERIEEMVNNRKQDA